MAVLASLSRRRTCHRGPRPAGPDRAFRADFGARGTCGRAIRPAGRLPVVVLVAAVVLGACGGSVEGAPPDVLLVVVDTLRADRTTAVRPGLVTTPHCEALGRRGITYRTAVAPSSWTLPSMAAFFGAREVTARRTAAFADAPVLAERFAAAGYRTVALVGNPLLTSDNGFDRGFEQYVVAPPESTSLRATEQDLRGWDAGALVARALAAWEDRADDRPLFLYLHLMDPHLPYDSAHSERVAPQPGWSAGTAPGEPVEVVWAERLTPEQDDMLRGWRRAYDGQVAFADEQLGRLFAAVGDDVLVAVTSDHGEGLFSHAQNPDREPGPGPLGMAYEDHGEQLYEEALRVPLWLAGPGVPAGRIETRPVDTKRLGDTLLALAGARVDGELAPTAGDRSGVGDDRLTQRPGVDRGAPATLPLADADPVPDTIFGVGSRGWFARTAERKLLMPFLERLEHPDVTRRLVEVTGGPASAPAPGAPTGPGYAPEARDLRPEEPDQTARLADLWNQWFTTHLQVPETAADPATEERLRALGYVR